jgi:hypothetical protein
VVFDGAAMSLQQLVGERLTSIVSATTSGTGGRLFGGANADYLTDSNGGNTVSGGRGDDQIRLLSGAGGIVTMAVGDGVDRVTAVRRTVPTDAQATPPKNVLRLGNGFVADQLRVYRVGPSTYLLSLNATGDGVRYEATSGPGDVVAAADYPFDTIAA